MLDQLTIRSTIFDSLFKTTTSTCTLTEMWHESFDCSVIKLKGYVAMAIPFSRRRVSKHLADHHRIRYGGQTTEAQQSSPNTVYASQRYIYSLSGPSTLMLSSLIGRLFVHVTNDLQTGFEIDISRLLCWIFLAAWADCRLHWFDHYCRRHKYSTWSSWRICNYNL